MRMYYYPDKKNNLSFGSLIKTINSNTNQNPYSSRSMTQVAAHKNKNSKEKCKGKFSSFNAKEKINKSKNRDNKATLLEKDKEINELILKLTMYKNKLNYINNQKSFNITNNTSSLNSCNLSKTKSSTTLTERNINSINSLSLLNREYKVKPTCNLLKNKNTNFISSNTNKNQLIKNVNILSKIRAKSSNYNKNNNCILKNTNKKTKVFYSCNNPKKNAINKNNNKNCKINNIHTINTNNMSDTYKILSIANTKKIYDDILEKTKNILEMVKKATTG